MINYFFYSQTFASEAIDVMIKCLNDMNEAVLCCNQGVEKFCHDESFYSLHDKDGNMTNQMICDANPSLGYRVLPAMFRHFQTVPSGVICEDLEGLRKNYPIECCLFGIFYAPIDYNHISCLADFKRNRITIARSIVAPHTFQKLSSMLFEKLKFSEDALQQYIAMGQEVMSNLMGVFIRMNNYCMNWKDGSIQVYKMQTDFGILISDESDTVKNDSHLSAQRNFFVSEKIGYPKCFLHVKVGNLRIHIFPDNESNTIFITYIGKHLSTKKYKC